jgi:hypothetical protein
LIINAPELKQLRNGVLVIKAGRDIAPQVAEQI